MADASVAVKPTTTVEMNGFMIFSAYGVHLTRS